MISSCKFVLLAASVSSSLFAVDGVLLLDQNKALAGNVTPGDTPGFPITISQPGSYRLDGNLTVPDANTSAIVITANDVMLDLNGFSIIGPTVCLPGTFSPATSCSPLGTGTGVSANSNFNTTVKNGTVRGMGGNALFLKMGTVDQVRLISNGGSGLSFSTHGGIATGNFIFNNGGFGILSSSTGSVISGNVVELNGLSGIAAAGVISGNSSWTNGDVGILVTCPSSVVNNTVSGNSNVGFLLTGNGCVSSNNTP